MEGNWKYSLICSLGQASILLIEFVTYLWEGNVSSSSVVLCVTAILGDNSGPQVEYRETHKSFAMVTVLQGAPIRLNETCTMSSKLRDYLTIRQRGLLICLLKYRWFAGP